MRFALGLIAGAVIGTSALFLPRADLPGEAHAAALQEAMPAGALAAVAPAAAGSRSGEEPGLAGRQARMQARPAGLLALGGPVERLPAAAPAPAPAPAPPPAVETRKVWWKMPVVGAAPFAVGNAR
jgi:hypothetical protein